MSINTGLSKTKQMRGCNDRSMPTWRLLLISEKELAIIN